MKNLAKILFAVFGVLFLAYLIFPSPPFPKTLWDFVASTEPADKETSLRQGYYTNLTRDQLMAHYARQFVWGIRLNYPPEEAQQLIRDQTQSTFLEEIVHPLKESLFVNGYEPKPDKQILEVNGIRYNQKVIVKYVGSNLFVRLAVGITALALIWILVGEWITTLKNSKWTFRL